MPIPNYQELMKPVLNFAQDGKEHHVKEARNAIETIIDLTPDERNQKLSSGQTVIANRIGWAISYLKSAGLIESKKRGYFNITQAGLDVLKKHSGNIDNEFLKTFPEFFGNKNYNNKENNQQKTIVDEKMNLAHDNINTSFQDNRTPEEIIADSYTLLRKKLKNELLEQIKQCSPAFFERLVVELLVKMGYGGSMEEAAAEVVGKSGDEGIDGIIKEDKLGLGVIYVQAKRWENPVGRPEIQKFAGALMGKRAKKGVFITNSVYTNGAYEYTKSVESKIILIDGNKLAQYMIDFDLGVSREQIFEIKRIDSDYFEED